MIKTQLSQHRLENHCSKLFTTSKRSHWGSHALWNSSAFAQPPQKSTTCPGELGKNNRAPEQLLCLQRTHSPALLSAPWSRESDLAGLRHLLPPFPALPWPRGPAQGIRERLHSRTKRLLHRHRAQGCSSRSFVLPGNRGMLGRDPKVQPVPLTLFTSPGCPTWPRTLPGVGDPTPGLTGRISSQYPTLISS